MFLECPKCRQHFQAASSPLAEGGSYGRCPACNRLVIKQNKPVLAPPEPDAAVFLPADLNSSSGLYNQNRQAASSQPDAALKPMAISTIKLNQLPSAETACRTPLVHIVPPPPSDMPDRKKVIWEKILVIIIVALVFFPFPFVALCVQLNLFSGKNSSDITLISKTGSRINYAPKPVYKKVDHKTSQLWVSISIQYDGNDAERKSCEDKPLEADFQGRFLAIEASGDDYYERKEVNLADLTYKGRISDSGQITCLASQHTVHFKSSGFSRDKIRFAVTPDQPAMQRLAAAQYRVSLAAHEESRSGFNSLDANEQLRCWFILLLFLLIYAALCNALPIVAVVSGVLLVWRIVDLIYYLRTGRSLE